MTMEERLEWVEKELRVERRRGVRGVGVLCGLVIAMGVAAWCAARPAKAGDKVVRATKFELVDEGGRVRGVWAAATDGPVFVLYGSGGTVAMSATGTGGAQVQVLRGRRVVWEAP